MESSLKIFVLCKRFHGCGTTPTFYSFVKPIMQIFFIALERIFLCMAWFKPLDKDKNFKKKTISHWASRPRLVTYFINTIIFKGGFFINDGTQLGGEESHTLLRNFTQLTLATSLQYQLYRLIYGKLQSVNWIRPRWQEGPPGDR